MRASEKVAFQYLQERGVRKMNGRMRNVKDEFGVENGN